MKTIVGIYFLIFKQAHMMNSITRMIFEHTYEATVDADIIPEDTRDTRTDVFTLMCFFDSEIFVSQKT